MDVGVGDVNVGREEDVGLLDLWGIDFVEELEGLVNGGVGIRSLGWGVGWCRFVGWNLLGGVLV